MGKAWLFAGLALVLAAGTARAGAPVAVWDLNFADYSGFTFEIPENPLADGTYLVTLTSNAAVTDFMLETVETFNFVSFNDNGTISGGDEGIDNILAFETDPTTEGHPFTDSAIAVIPGETTPFFTYYPDGHVETETTWTVDQELITVLSFDPTGAAVVTVSAIPEPASWAMLIAGAALAGVGLRSCRRRDASATT